MIALCLRTIAILGALHKTLNCAQKNFIEYCIQTPIQIYLGASL